MNLNKFIAHLALQLPEGSHDLSSATKHVADDCSFNDVTPSGEEPSDLDRFGWADNTLQGDEDDGAKGSMNSNEINIGYSPHTNNTRDNDIENNTYRNNRYPCRNRRPPGEWYIANIFKESVRNVTSQFSGITSAEN